MITRIVVPRLSAQLENAERPRKDSNARGSSSAHGGQSAMSRSTPPTLAVNTRPHLPASALSALNRGDGQFGNHHVPDAGWWGIIHLTFASFGDPEARPAPRSRLRDDPTGPFSEQKAFRSAQSVSHEEKRSEFRCFAPLRTCRTAAICDLGCVPRHWSTCRRGRRRARRPCAHRDRRTRPLRCTRSGAFMRSEGTTSSTSFRSSV